MENNRLLGRFLAVLLCIGAALAVWTYLQADGGAWVVLNGIYATLKDASGDPMHAAETLLVHFGGLLIGTGVVWWALRKARGH